MPWNVIDTRRRRLLTPNFNSILPNSKGCPWLFNLDVIAVIAVVSDGETYTPFVSQRRDVLRTGDGQIPMQD
ncbi:hypothetical protein AFLA_001454 [Aspergillus flavus NRRL3357]|nr:hypothetical protein AFLA_001454 [Aspergillus flavus NRRL3357]